MFPRRKKLSLDKIVPGQTITGRNGEVYQVDHVITDGNKVLHSMTLERLDKAKRPEGMSPRQFRNMKKAQRRLERNRKERRIEAALNADCDMDVNAGLEEGATIKITPGPTSSLWPWRRTS